MFVTVDYPGDGSDQPDAKAADKTIALLRTHTDKPFFIATGFVRPHYPNVAPEQYFKRYDYTKIPLPHIPADDLSDIPKPGWSNSRSETTGMEKYPENQQRMWAAYYATVTFMDEQLGRILHELEILGLRESTAIVFTSDHGYHLGEHTFWQKSNLHEEVTRVPLIISVPGMPAGRTQALTELVDIYPTVCDLLHATTPVSVQGKSLMPVLADAQTSIRSAAISFEAKHQALRTTKWAYMHYQDGSEELYHMETDPGQFTNVAHEPQHRAELTALRRLLNEHVSMQQPAKQNKK
jgi:iduronate 2-sulfatase